MAGAYEVPGMQLISQTKNMACWYASAQMLIQWKRSMTQSTLMNHPDPSELTETVKWEVLNKGITNPQVVKLALALGLEQVPPLTPTPGYLLRLMQTYGPLWTNGTSHIVVIAGIDEDNELLKVYDPWPWSGKPQIAWRSFSWYTGSTPSSRDISAEVQAVFLYHP